MTKTLTETDLHQFTGSESFYRHWCNRAFIYTEGVHHVAEHGGACWLIDEIALTIQHDKQLSAQPFQHWTLTVAADHIATIVCTDGNGRKLFHKELTFTDFPLAQIDFYACENELGPRHFTLMLTSEY